MVTATQLPGNENNFRSRAPRYKLDTVVIVNNLLILNLKLKYKFVNMKCQLLLLLIVCIGCSKSTETQSKGNMLHASTLMPHVWQCKQPDNYVWQFDFTQAAFCSMRVIYNNIPTGVDIIYEYSFTDTTITLTNINQLNQPTTHNYSIRHDTLSLWGLRWFLVK